ncbi:hypothetical protein ABZ307_27265 [Streptomyces griseorubiginosus]|uniref:hypothetical protein n=1 Tax=Streptomyces griseorubiginosus TaxID=67304 RepID=UPI0033B166A5
MRQAPLPGDGRGRLLDAGCGPGTALLTPARCFTEAIGLDPPAGLGTFRTIVFAQCFHWTDRDRVAVNGTPGREDLVLERAGF